MGSVVVDRDATDPDPMRVLDPAKGAAHATRIKGRDTTVAAANPGYPADDPVVETVYESWLDHTAAGWRDWPESELATRLREFTKTWRLPTKSYYYPRSRLKRRA